MTDPLNLMVLMAAMSLLPFFCIVATSFVKITVVLHLVRNALGVQNVPPNMALNALALLLSAYVMAPVEMETYKLVQAGIGAGQFQLDTFAGVSDAYQVAKGPFETFLSHHAAARERHFFLQAAQELWPADMSATLTADSMMVILPSFTVSQLREAFEIGFLLYLPFVVIDLIVSNILLAMGMMMVSPLTIALPFKLFLFVMIDGWSRLVLGLVRSYV